MALGSDSQFRNFGSSKGGPGDVPELRLPRLDTGRFAGRIQEQLAPTRSSLSRRLNELGGTRFSSPTAKRRAFREAFRGAGESLSTAQAGATQVAFNIEQADLEAETREAMQNFRTAMARLDEERRKRENTSTPIQGAPVQRTRPTSVRRRTGGNIQHDPTASLPANLRAAAAGFRPTTGTTISNSKGSYPSNWAS